jgi:hypothetical protein
MIKTFLAAMMIALALGGVTGCRSVSLPDGRDLATPGWKVQEGQAVWQPRRRGPELAGEVILSRHTNGHFVVHFTKTPLPLVVAEGWNEDLWRIEFVPEHREYKGRGPARRHFGWLLLPSALEGAVLPRGWQFARKPEGRWRLENPGTGEFLEGYLTP